MAAATATTTADGRYDYFREINGTTLIDHARKVTSDRGIRRIEPGEWITDRTVSMLGAAMDAISGTKEEIAEAVHLGYTRCYRYWFENSPFREPSAYKGPFLVPKTRRTYREKEYAEISAESKDVRRRYAEYAIANFR